MKITKKIRRVFVLLLCLTLAAVGTAFAGELTAQTLVIENGVAQPMLTYSSYKAEDYSNGSSDILRFTVYVETDYDTDGDGKDDLVKVFMQVPRAAVEGGYQAGVIYDPTPYSVGTVDDADVDMEPFYNEELFDYDKLYRAGEKRTPTGETDTLSHALSQDESEWNYAVPSSGRESYPFDDQYIYYLIRGYAVAQSSGIGTLGSEGYELCGFDLEAAAHRCVVEWLAGNRVAYTDKEGTTQIRADWSNGKVAMTGHSYGGTLPFAVATTGVEGLETIIPFCGIASWYDYTNSQGVTKHFYANYTDYLAAYNAGALLLDENGTTTNPGYGSLLYTIARDEDSANGDYTDIWARLDYTKNYANIRCSALIVQGLNDQNVTTRHADLMAQSFRKAGQKFTLMLHQDGHNMLYGNAVNDSVWDELMNLWLCHYLYDVDNGAEDLPEVIAQSNIDGTYQAYDSWRDFDYLEASAASPEASATITTVGFMDFVYESLSGGYGDGTWDEFLLSMPQANAVVYDIDLPEGTTVYGMPKVSFKASTGKAGFEGLMISAALVDTIDGQTYFPAYLTEAALGDCLSTVPVSTFDYGGGIGTVAAMDFEQTMVTAKAFSYGWTDLANPGSQEDSSTYTESVDLEAGKEYDYTFYMMPTVYTLAEGHRLKLVIYTWDPNTNAFLDESAGTNDEKAVEYYNYDCTIDNTTLRVEIPVR